MSTDTSDFRGLLSRQKTLSETAQIRSVQPHLDPRYGVLILAVVDFSTFIEPSDGGKDLFVHMSEIQMEGYKTLKDGQNVEYEIAESDRGPAAKNVVPK
mgnify:CR=1 FL=1